MDDKVLLEGRLRELDRLAYNRDILKHTGFLNLEEQAVYHKIKSEFLTPNKQRAINSGHDNGERAIIMFIPDYMDEDTAVEESIALVKISPVNLKFTDQLTHRDYLGALMNLGIDRGLIGDILTDGKTAFVYCLKEIADFITAELFRVKHTSVRCETVSLAECSIEPEFEELDVNVASERLDAVISAVWNISRNISAELIKREAVTVDGRYIIQPGYDIRDDERVSVRGYGKFRYCGMERSTKKGRLYVKIKKYI